MPVLVRVDVTRGRTRPYLVAGPVFGFNVSASAEGGPGAVALGLRLSGGIEEAVEPFELAVAAGGGVQVRRVLLEGRLTRGLTDMNKPRLQLAKDARISAFAVLAGLRL